MIPFPPTPEQRQRLLEEQGSVCAICGYKPAKSLHADHDHATNITRGMLCSDCNIALGLMRDRPEVLRAAAEYLEEHQRRWQAWCRRAAGKAKRTA